MEERSPAVAVDEAVESDVELLEPGNPPRRRLRYAFRTDGEQHYLIQSEMKWSGEDGTLAARYRVPLSVLRTSPFPEVTTLRLGLGPVERERWAPDQGVSVEREDTELRVQVEVDARGVIREVRGVDSEGTPALVGHLDSLLARDVLPATDVGLGARWRHERTLQTGHVIVSELELIELADETLTLRVWREQRGDSKDESQLKTNGEWTVHLSSWPPLGIDSMHETTAGPARERISMQTSFAIMKRASELQGAGEK